MNSYDQARETLEPVLGRASAAFKAVQDAQGGKELLGITMGLAGIENMLALLITEVRAGHLELTGGAPCVENASGGREETLDQSGLAALGVPEPVPAVAKPLTFADLVAQFTTMGPEKFRNVFLPFAWVNDTVIIGPGHQLPDAFVLAYMATQDGPTANGKHFGRLLARVEPMWVVSSLEEPGWRFVPDQRTPGAQPVTRLDITPTSWLPPTPTAPSREI